MSQEKKEKCRKCGKRDATGEDGFCDHCRFMAALGGIAKDRE